MNCVKMMRGIVVGMMLALAMCVQAQDWLKLTGAKRFPESGRVYCVNDYGAFQGKVIASTAAIQKAIDVCSANGGGKVTFLPGVYHTGAIYLKSNVNFEIAEGVELRALMDVKYYPEILTRVAGIEMMWPCGVINVLDQENVAITGKGTLHAQGKVHWEHYWNLREAYTPMGLRWASDYDSKRVRTLEVANSRHVTISGITIKQAGFWTVHVMYCNNVTVDGVIIRNNIDGKGPSTDGVDIDSSSYVEVMNCDIDCNDDNYCVKAGRDADGLRVNRPSEYIWFHDNIARAGGGVLVIGSETSGWIRHVRAERMKAYGSGNVLHLKSAMTRGGGAEDITVVDCQADGVRNLLHVTLNWNPNYSYARLPDGMTEMPEHWKVMTQPVPDGKGIARFSNITLENCTAINVYGTAFDVEGLEVSPITDVTVRNVDVQAAVTGQLKHVSNWKLENIKITTPKGERLMVENDKKVTLKQVTYHAGGDNLIVRSDSK
ncbi:MAG: glycoside hydrolase family 28 protein [Marinilabiliaceae bacterium]|nr:glycoside hydrolase family 28 protein [Marinilabiliaceae bacterium]